MSDSGFHSIDFDFRNIKPFFFLPGKFNNCSVEIHLHCIISVHWRTQKIKYKDNNDFHAMKARDSQNMYIYWKSNNPIVTGIVTSRLL